MNGSKQQLVEERLENFRSNTDFVATIFGSKAGYGIVAADFDGNILDFSEGAHQIYGYTPEEVTGKKDIQIFFPRDFIEAGKLQEIIDVLIEKEAFSYEGENVKKNGERFPVQIVFTLTKDLSGKIIGFIEIVEDLTERKRTQEVLQATLTNFHNIVEHNSDGIVITDQEGVVRLVNPAAEALFERKPEEFLGELFDFPLVVGETREVDIVRGNGQTAAAEMQVVETEWEGETAYLASLRDITERKQAEEALQKAYRELQQLHTKLKESQAQLVQTEKMGALGVMAAGIAHELLNPLIGILNYVQFCRKRTAEDDPRHDVLQDIERETKRCTDIVKNVVTFSRMGQEGEEEYQKESLATIIERVVKLLAYRIDAEKVTLARHVAEGTPAIPMKVNGMQQVLLNVITNAMDAVKESEKKEVNVEVYQEGGFIRVNVSDSGVGIAPENMEKLFDPFFTTKPADKGTGLGLTIVRSIVQAHGGEITCQSEPGAGTTFNMLLLIKNEKEVTE